MDGPPSLDAAVAVAEYFTLLYPYVYATGDLSEWTALSHPECNFCASVNANVSDIFSKGQHSEGGKTKVLARDAVEISPGASYTATIDFTEDASSTVDASGVVVEDFPGQTTNRSTLVVLWADDAWLIRGVDVEDLPQ